MRHVIQTHYLSSVYEPEEFQKTVKNSLKRIRQFMRTKDGQFDAIAFTGTSGAAMAYIIAHKLNVGLICIRKDKSSHYKGKVEGVRNAKKYIIIDDFIDSGNTIGSILDSVKVFSPKAKCSGIFLYDEEYDDIYKWSRIVNSKNKESIKIYACG